MYKNGKSDISASISPPSGTLPPTTTQNAIHTREGERLLNHKVINGKLLDQLATELRLPLRGNVNKQKIYKKGKLNKTTSIFSSSV